MHIVGLLRVRNEARWIERSIASLLPACDRILVMDDHSDDNTPFLCASFPRAQVFDSPFADLNETRDKNWLLDKARQLKPDWCVMIDGDEAFAPGSAERLLAAMQATDMLSVSMRIPYLWDCEDQIRMDGVYGEYRRHSAFRPRNFTYQAWRGGGFHCGNVPAEARRSALTIDAIQLLHFGYLHAEDRERKYCWYNAKDPGNIVENCYRHIAAGLNAPHQRLIDTQERIRRESGLPELLPLEILPPAPSATDRTMHAGPLRLEALCAA